MGYASRRRPQGSTPVTSPPRDASIVVTRVLASSMPGFIKLWREDVHKLVILHVLHLLSMGLPFASDVGGAHLGLTKGRKTRGKFPRMNSGSISGWIRFP